MTLTEKQTEQLVKACVQNDRNAQEALYKLYYADMLKVCNSYLPDIDLASEAFNTGFLKVFQSIQNFNPNQGTLGGWIMISTSIDLCRNELRFSNPAIENYDQEEAFMSPAVLDKLYFEDILAHIRTLPYAAQMVFNLSVLDGFSHKEISEQLNISEGTSRWYLSGAKKQLRTLLEAAINDHKISIEGRGEKR